MVLAAVDDIRHVCSGICLRLDFLRRKYQGVRIFWTSNVDVLDAREHHQALLVVAIENLRRHRLFIRLEAVEHARRDIALESPILRKRVLAPIHAEREKRLAVDEGPPELVEGDAALRQSLDALETASAYSEHLPILLRELKVDILFADRQLGNVQGHFGKVAGQLLCRLARQASGRVRKDKRPRQVVHRFGIGIRNKSGDETHVAVGGGVRIHGVRETNGILAG